MKKMLKQLLVCFVIFSYATSLVASSKKTFLMPRSFNTNLAMEYTTWHDLVFNYPYKNQTNLQFTPFYQASTEGSDIGEYFGVGNSKNSFKIFTEANVNAGTADVINRFLIHDHNGDLHQNIDGTVVLTPKQRAGGLRIDFFQHLNFPFKKMFFKASMPLVYLENDLNYEVKDVENDPKSTILSFFKGETIEQTLDSNKQNALTHAKLPSSKKSKFGVADIDIALGYKLIAEENKHLFLNAGVTIPTGTRTRGEYLFEPVYGNGHHVALGLGLDAAFRLWKKQRHSGKIFFAVNYRYLFEGTEKRTIPLNKVDFKAAHYYLTAKKDVITGTALTPAANILTQDVSVRPGNQFDAIAMFNFKSKRFLLDIGYNLYTKETESVSLKGKWTDDTYGVVTDNFDVMGAAAHPFDPTDANYSKFAINNSTLDIQGAATPSQLTHKLFGGLGYKFTIISYPSAFGIGGSYEFVNSNNALENYAIWAKLGLSF